MIPITKNCQMALDIADNLEINNTSIDFIKFGTTAKRCRPPKSGRSTQKPLKICICRVCFASQVQQKAGIKLGAPENPETLENIGDRERIRTAGLQLRSFGLLTKT